MIEGHKQSEFTADYTDRRGLPGSGFYRRKQRGGGTTPFDKFRPWAEPKGNTPKTRKGSEAEFGQEEAE